VFAAGYDDGKVEVFDGALFNCLAVSFVSAVNLMCTTWQQQQQQQR
jgi:hypothetical protein